MADKIVKTMSPILCPHCGQESLVSFRAAMPSVDWVLKPEVIKGTKDKLIAELEKLEFRSPTDKKEIIAWLSDENTAFGPEEADAVLDQIVRDYVRADATEKP